MQHEHNIQQPEHLTLDNGQVETTSKLEWVQPVLQKAPIAGTAFGIDDLTPFNVSGEDPPG
jgi:hypothetical protein